MDVSDLPRIIFGGGTLVLLAFLLYKFAMAFRDTTHALGDMAEGVVAALAKHNQLRIQEEHMFYTRPWTEEEAMMMLAELRHQLANRLRPGDSPEVAILGPEIRNTALALAVLTRIVPCTLEIRRRIAFLEEKVRQRQSSLPNQSLYAR